MVFNTLLLKDLLSETQEKFYQNAYARLGNNEFVVMNQRCEICHVVHVHSEILSFMANIKTRSDWFPHIMERTHLNGVNIKQELIKMAN